MRFAIISDSHDHLPNLRKVVDFLHQENITMLLHCGDICNQETVGELQNMFKGEIFFVRGNGDFTLEDIPETLNLEFDGKRIFINHYPDVARRGAESGKYDLVFYGHTHKPWEERVGYCRLINPGEIAGSRYKPTFAMYDTKTEHLELKILEKLMI